jgi:hypothetical protein
LQELLHTVLISKMVRYSFLVGLFHPRLHAGLSRRLRSVTVAARKVSRPFEDLIPSRDREVSGCLPNEDFLVG